MILEVAILIIKSGQESAFEFAFEKAGQYISLTKGYINHSLQKCLEQENKYILFVNWESVEDHTIGFRQSAQYIEWKNLLNHFYDQNPVVEHYVTMVDYKR